MLFFKKHITSKLRYKYIRTISMLILILWFSLSCFRVLINFVNFIFQDSRLLFMTTEKKKQEQYGDIYNFSKFIEQKTDQGSIILFQSQDLRNFFLLRYFTYPRKIYAFTAYSMNRYKGTVYAYFIIYNNKSGNIQQNIDINDNKYKYIYTYHSKIDQTISVNLYKKL